MRLGKPSYERVKPQWKSTFISANCIDYAVAYQNMTLIEWMKNYLGMEIDVKQIQLSHMNKYRNIPKERLLEVARSLVLDPNYVKANYE